MKRLNTEYVQLLEKSLLHNPVDTPTFAGSVLISPRIVRQGKKHLCVMSASKTHLLEDPVSYVTWIHKFVTSVFMDILWIFADVP